EYLLRRFKRRVIPADSLQPQLSHVRNLTGRSNPLAAEISHVAERQYRVSGTGVYLRTDFWHPITSGGSYGHTSYLAKALASTTDKLICLVPYHFELLDELGIHQVVLPRFEYKSEFSLVEASAHYL